MIYYLAYVSSATHLLNQQELQVILSGSNGNNRRDGITGVLLYYGGNILQVLEGEEQTVKERFNLIRQDPRHKGVIKLLEGHWHERTFAQWFMAFKEVSSEQFRNLEGFLRAAPHAVAEAPFLPLIRLFYNTNYLN